MRWQIAHKLQFRSVLGGSSNLCITPIHRPLGMKFPPFGVLTESVRNAFGVALSHANGLRNYISKYTHRCLSANAIFSINKMAPNILTLFQSYWQETLWSDKSWITYPWMSAIKIIPSTLELQGVKSGKFNNIFFELDFFIDEYNKKNDWKDNLTLSRVSSRWLRKSRFLRFSSENTNSIILGKYWKCIFSWSSSIYYSYLQIVYGAEYTFNYLHSFQVYIIVKKTPPSLSPRHPCFWTLSDVQSWQSKSTLLQWF